MRYTYNLHNMVMWSCQGVDCDDREVTLTLAAYVGRDIASIPQGIASFILNELEHELDILHDNIVIHDVEGWRKDFWMDYLLIKRVLKAHADIALNPSLEQR